VRAHYDKTRFQITFAFPPSLPKGQYLIRVRATDRAGNREQPPKRFHLTYK
jgi:fibronectin type 3 domain-containing protein